jgi:hypothetical protein
MSEVERYLKPLPGGAELAFTRWTEGIGKE